MTTSVDVAALNVRLQATLRRFEQQTDKAVRKLKRDAGKMERRAARLDKTLSNVGKSFGRGLTRTIVGLTAALSARALTRQAESIARSLDDIGKTADRLGLTTSALQELRAVGQNAGATFGQIDQVLTLFQRNLADFRDGVGEGKDAFEALGISGTDLDGKLLSTEEVLGQVSDGLAAIEDPARRTQIAYDLFGRSGVNVINTLSQGSAALDRNREAVRRNGEVVEESLIRKSEETVTKLGELQRQIDTNLARAFSSTQPLLTAWREVLVSISAAAAAASEAIQDFSASADGVTRGRNRGRRSGRRSEVESFQGQRSLAERQRALEARLAGANNNRSRRSAEANLREFLDRFGGLDAGDPRSGVFGDFAVPTAESTAPLPRSRPDDVPAARRRRGGGSAPPAPRSLSDILGDSGTRARDLSREQELLQLSQRQAAALAEEYRILDALVAEYGDNLDAAAAAGRLPDDFRRQVAERAEAYAQEEVALTRVEDQLRRNEEAQRAVAERAEEAARAQQEAIDELITGFGDAISQADSLEDALKRIGIELAEVAARAAFGQGPAGNLFNQLIGSSSGGILGLFSGSGAAPVSSPIPPPRPFAKGGVVRRKTSFGMADGGTGVAGEAGRPEGILPLAKASNGDLGVKAIGGGSSGPISIGPTTINITEPGASVEQIRTIVAQSQRDTIRKIQTKNIRNPRFLPS